MFQAQYRKPRGYHKKPSQRSKEENKITLGARHEQKVKEFETAMNKVLPLKERYLAQLEKQLEEQEKRTILNFTERELLFDLKKEIDRLRYEIKDLRNRTEENEYFLKTAAVLSEYNSEIGGGGDGGDGGEGDINEDEEVEAFWSGKKKNAVTLESWMKGEGQKPENIVDRRDLLEAWCIQTMPHYVSAKPFSEDHPNRCPDPDCSAINKICNSNGGRVNCAVCGTEMDVNFATRQTSFKEGKNTELMPEFPYKRINHFQEWLSQIQGKQNTEIVEKVFVGLKQEFTKNRITDHTQLTPKFVKMCLRKLGYTKYYEHAEYIIHHFNGYPPPILTIETEEEFRKMFREIQIPFALCKPPKRKNFLSYSYIFHQFAMLSEEDHLLNHFPLLKSRQKLKVQDDIWKDMCKILKWEFIPTV